MVLNPVGEFKESADSFGFVRLGEDESDVVEGGTGEEPYMARRGL